MVRHGLSEKVTELTSKACEGVSQVSSFEKIQFTGAGMLSIADKSQHTVKVQSSLWLVYCA